MPSLLVAHHRPGFYLRVIQEGTVQAGDDIALVERGRAAVTARRSTDCSTSRTARSALKGHCESPR